MWPWLCGPAHATFVFISVRNFSASPTTAPAQVGCRPMPEQASERPRASAEDEARGCPPIPGTAAAKAQGPQLRPSSGAPRLDPCVGFTKSYNIANHNFFFSRGGGEERTPQHTYFG